MKDDTLRILHIVQGMNRGGIETMLMNLYRYINRDDVQFDFMISCIEKSDYEEEILSLGGKIFRMSPINILTPNRYLKDVNRFFKENQNYKIVHSHMNAVSALPLYIAKKNHIPIRISHSHINFGGKGLKGIMKNIIRYPLRRVATHYFACSRDAAIFLFGKNYFEKQNSFILNNAISAEHYVYNPKMRLELRGKYNIEGKTVFGHIGRFNYQKNHLFILDIFELIHNGNPNAILMLIGDGELRMQIEEKIVKLGLGDSVILTGVVPNVCDYLQAMDIFLFPSLFEGLGMGLVEAQSAGLKCFASDSTPIESEITDLVTFISLNEKAEIWAEKILNVGKEYNRENMLSQIQNAGYDVKTTSKWLEDFYKSKINELKI
jgi:glycosyltransferase involved in cell wall biosynthesis